jgi:hypothetical protein
MLKDANAMHGPGRRRASVAARSAAGNRGTGFVISAKRAMKVGL